MNLRINKNQNEKTKLQLTEKYNLNKKYKISSPISIYNKYINDIYQSWPYSRIKYFPKNHINLNFISISLSKPISYSINIQKEININESDENFTSLKNESGIRKMNSRYKFIRPPTSQINRKQLFKNNSIGDFEIIKTNNRFSLTNNTGLSNLKNNNDNSNYLYKRIFPISSKYNYYKINGINNIIKNNKMLNKRTINNSNSNRLNSLNYCDASTNTLYENNKVENRQLNSIKKIKRPLMVDYFESEHKKFCYGFDKYKGRNKYKIPFFIVYKY